MAPRCRPASAGETGWAGICSIEAQARSVERIRARVSGLLKPTRVFVLFHYLPGGAGAVKSPHCRP